MICPASLKLNWRRELEKWLCRKRPIFIADSKLFPDLSDGIVVINYDILSRHTKQIKAAVWDAVIIDEAHFLKNRTALRTRQVFGREAKRSERAAGDQGEPAIRARKKILLTGTPIANRPNELFPLIHFLDPDNWPSFWSFARRYCGAHDNGFGWDVSGATNLEELQTKLRQTIMIRRLKKDVLTELPPKRRQVIELPATGAAVAVVRQEREAYAAREDAILAAQARVELAKASEDPAVYAESVKHLRNCMMVAFDEISALRHETAVAKIPQLIEFTRDAIEESGKVILFAHHKDRGQGRRPGIRKRSRNAGRRHRDGRPTGRRRPIPDRPDLHPVHRIDHGRRSWDYPDRQRARGHRRIGLGPGQRDPGRGPHAPHRPARKRAGAAPRAGEQPRRPHCQNNRPQAGSNRESPRTSARKTTEAR